MTYERTQNPYLSKVLLAGEFLGGDVYGGNYKNEVIGRCTKDGQVTNGIPSDFYDIDKLYDKNWPGGDWPKSEIVNRINEDIHIINHAGHSNYQYMI